MGRSRKCLWRRHRTRHVPRDSSSLRPGGDARRGIRHDRELSLTSLPILPRGFCSAPTRSCSAAAPSSLVTLWRSGSACLEDGEGSCASSKGSSCGTSRSFGATPRTRWPIAFAVYALVLAFDGRWGGAGWLFGAAVATQPVVVLIAPVFLALAGKSRAVPLLVRASLPSVLLLATPLVAEFHVTAHALVDQPNFPNVDHRTPWTSLAPRLGGSGQGFSVAAGPGSPRRRRAGVCHGVGGAAVADAPRADRVGDGVHFGAALLHRIGDGVVLRVAGPRRRARRRRCEAPPGAGSSPPPLLWASRYVAILTSVSGRGGES